MPAASSALDGRLDSSAYCYASLIRCIAVTPEGWQHRKAAAGVTSNEMGLMSLGRKNQGLPLPLSQRTSVYNPASRPLFTSLLACLLGVWAFWGTLARRRALSLCLDGVGSPGRSDPEHRPRARTRVSRGVSRPPPADIPQEARLHSNVNSPVRSCRGFRISVSLFASASPKSLGPG